MISFWFKESIVLTILSRQTGQVGSSVSPDTGKQPPLSENKNSNDFRLYMTNEYYFTSSFICISIKPIYNRIILE